MHTVTTSDLSVLELRRYTVAPGMRARFAQCFETWFPEVFQQLGASVVGHFFERDNDARFTWLRGYKDMAARASVNAAFYFGPVWKEHKATLNAMMQDSDNVLLLRPLNRGCGLPILRAVDPAVEPSGAGGIVVAHLFQVRDGQTAAFAQAAERTFANYRGKGVVEAGILVTLDEPNNFPQHPIRTDASFLVWLGVLRDGEALDCLRPSLEAAAADLARTGMLGGPTELVVLDPCRRSRLRWMPIADTRAVRSAA